MSKFKKNREKGVGTFEYRKMGFLDKDGPLFSSKKIRETWYLLYALFWNVMTSFLMFSDHGTLEELVS